MNAIAALVVATFRHNRRDRTAVAFLVLLPIGLMVVMGNIYAAADNPVPRVLVHVAEPGPISDHVIETLEAGGAVTLERTDSLDDLDDAVRRRSVDAGLVLREGSSVELVGAPDVQLPDGVRLVVTGAVSRVDRALSLATASPDLNVADALAGLPAQDPLPDEDPREARTQAAIGVLVLVTFMNVIAYGSLLPDHRDVGVLGRLGAAPVPRWVLVAGYGTTFVAVAAMQTTIAVAAGRFLVGIDWGPLPQVAVVGAGLAVAAGGVATLGATLLPTPESGTTIGGPIGFALGMLGGCLWPLEFVGGTLESIGQWVPHYWAVDGLRSVADGSATLSGLATAAGALAAAGALFAAIGARRLASFWG